jgi:hypothetical protein
MLPGGIARFVPRSGAYPFHTAGIYQIVIYIGIATVEVVSNGCYGQKSADHQAHPFLSRAQG